MYDCVIEWLKKQLRILKENIKELLKKCITLLILSLIVTYGWQGLELFIIGKINPNDVDSVVGLILILSLYYNINNIQRCVNRRSEK